jgi:hypothetical protein
MVRREGMKPFEFEEVHRDIASGAISGYLDAEGWEILKGYGITPQGARGRPQDGHERARV